MTWRKTLPSWVPIRIKTPFCISDPTSMAEKVSNIYSYRNIWHMSKQNHFKLWFYLFVPTAVKGYLYIWIYWLGEYFRIHRLLIKHWSQITWYQTKKTTKDNCYKDKTFTFHFKSWFLLVTQLSATSAWFLTTASDNRSNCQVRDIQKFQRKAMVMNCGLLPPSPRAPPCQVFPPPSPPRAGRGI